MKKLILTLAVACGALFTQAQTDEHRVLLYKNHSTTPVVQLASRVDSIAFQKIEGPLAAVDVTVGEYYYNEEKEWGELPLTITRNESCVAFQCGVYSANQVDALADDSELAGAVEQTAGDLYWQDYPAGTVFDQINMPDGADYYVVCLAYDQWSTPCSITKVKFTIPKRPLVGDPKVEATFTNVTDRAFDVTLTPNADCLSYGYLGAWKGQVELQSAMMGGVEGYLSSFFAATGTAEQTIHYDWNYYEPGTEFEVAVLPKDADGRYDGVQWFYQKTLPHGDGVTPAQVDVTIGDYFDSDWMDENGETAKLPTLHVDFTPNAGANCYRYSAWTKDVYEQNPEACIESVATDMDPTQWAITYFYNIDPAYDEFQLDPNTDVVIVAIAKNNDGTWGEPNIVEYTTPAQTTTGGTATSQAQPGIAAQTAAKALSAQSTVKLQRANRSNGQAQTLPFIVRPVQKTGKSSTAPTLKLLNLDK